MGIEATAQNILNKIEFKKPPPLLPPLPPTYCFHYTSQETFSKIIDLKELWLSNIRDMNDPLELKVGLDYLSYILRSREDIVSLIKEEKEEMLKPSVYSKYNGLYVLSMSSQKDSLYHWNSYATTKGVSIGFHTGKLQDFIREIIPSSARSIVCSMPVSYVDKDARCLKKSPIQDFEEYCINLLSKTHHEIENNEDKTFFLQLVLFFASLIKSDFHMIEEEWRICVFVEGMGSPFIKTKLRGDEIRAILSIPFLKQGLDKIINNIVLGPHVSMGETKEQVFIKLCHENGLAQGIISKSKGLLI